MISFSKCQDTKVWNEFLKHERAEQLITIGHNPSLGPILEKTFGYKSENLVIESDDKIVGVLPVVKMREKIVSMPHFSYGGPILTSTGQIEVDLKRAFDNKKFMVRSLNKLTNYFNDKKVTCILQLESSTEEQFMGLKSNFRRKIRKADRLNLKFLKGGIELLDDFFMLYSKRMLQMGSPPLGKNFFKNLLSDYRFGEAQIVSLYDDDKVVGSGFTLSYLGFNELCWVACHRNYTRTNVNSLLYWNIIKHSIARGYTYFSMGRSTINSTNHDYKKQWKPMEHRVYYNYSEPVGKSIKEFTFLTKIWSFLPLSVSVFMGRIVSKYIY